MFPKAPDIVKPLTSRNQPAAPSGDFKPLARAANEALRNTARPPAHSPDTTFPLTDAPNRSPTTADQSQRAAATQASGQRIEPMMAGQTGRAGSLTGPGSVPATPRNTAGRS